MIYIVAQETCECICFLTSSCSTVPLALTNPIFCVLTSLTLSSSSRSAVNYRWIESVHHDAQCNSVRKKSHFPNSKFQKSIRECCLYLYGNVRRAKRCVSLLLKMKYFDFCKMIDIDPDVIWTRNLLIWSQTRYRCATESWWSCFEC